MRASLVLALLAIALASPTLFVGFYTDDHAQLAALRGVPGALSVPPFDLYLFATADRRTEELRARGLLPWWSHPELRIAFARPLASATLWLDYAVAGERAVLWHAHSLLWLGALVVVALALFRRILPPKVALTGALLVAIDDAHWESAGWLAARHGLLAAVFGTAAVAVHVRAQEERSGLVYVAGLIAFAAALASSEVGAGALGYLVAYEWLGRRERRGALVALAPHVVAAIVYVALHRAGGYGASQSGAYIDPLVDPGQYLLGGGGRLGALLGAALVGIPSDVWMTIEGARPWLAVTGLAATMLFALVVRDVLAAIPHSERATLAWLLAGAALSLVPFAGAQIGDRLLVMPGIGLAGALAIVMHRGRECIGIIARVGRRIAIVIHAVLAPVLLVAMSANLVRISAAADRIAFDPALPLDAPDVDVIVLVAADPAAGLFAGIARAANARTATRTFHVISMAPCDHVLGREAVNSLVLRAECAMLRSPIESVVRRPGDAIGVGHEARMRGISIRVEAADAEGPRGLRLTLERPIEDPRLRIVSYREGALRAVKVPEVGGEIALPHEPGPHGI